ncbi:disintegrin and metalloproteinase domain-containing protein 11 isoform X4 [Astyanax mexicanus]|uniref:disintegrin and metalloproteinase domain-containing protein 11 isoform X4 n=1 Tax=Astyanax mexicanus TaxID=7994 RepID=UPI0020CB4123|nr:disintegrin and metalloproteinase domain-containing protein 11 isoform X4 [Astyanax mexicanus]
MPALPYLLWAAVAARLAVAGCWGAAMTDWGDAGELTEPRRLQQQVDEGELAHHRLDSRVTQDAVTMHPVHLAQISFMVQAFGTPFILDLELNHDLLSSDYVERNFEENGTPSENQGGEHCYYHGVLRGVKGSWAALSTCSGLWGVFSDGNFSYGIEPVQNSDKQIQSGHIVHKMPNIRLTTPHCPECSRDTERDSTAEDDQFFPVEFPTFTYGLRRAKRQIRKPQRSVQTETKYVELLVVNDYDLFVQMRRSNAQTRNFAKAVVNMADAIYKEQLNTRIVLVAMETWSAQNMVYVGDDPLTTLRDFMKYRRENIKDKSDAAHLFSGRTFHSARSGTAYIEGICSLTRGGGVNEYGNVGPMAITLCQSLGQNLGMMWNKERATAGDCRCPDPWLGCIMEDTGYYLPRKFSRCSVEEYVRFLQEGGGSCLFNKPTKLLDPPECGNGFVEQGEECDCGSQVDCSRAGGACCKKCTLTHDAMCSNGLCCNRCRYEQRGIMCRDAVNDCDVPEMCTGDSSQCPPNVHKLDGYTCDAGQGRCYGGRCKTRDAQCQALWGHNAADRMCYEKLNTEGTEKGNCGRDPSGQGWVQCNKHGGHAVLEDGSDLGYVEDGTPCGPNMMCLDHRCLPVVTFNLSSCPGSSPPLICSDHGTCSNEVKCICDADYTGKDCSVYDPIPDPMLLDGPEKYKGPSGTNIIIGSLAGAILLAAIVLGGTGWGFKNIRRGRYDSAEQ